MQSQKCIRSLLTLQSSQRGKTSLSIHFTALDLTNFKSLDMTLSKWQSEKRDHQHWIKIYQHLVNTNLIQILSGHQLAKRILRWTLIVLQKKMWSLQDLVTILRIVNSAVMQIWSQLVWRETRLPMIQDLGQEHTHLNVVWPSPNTQLKLLTSIKSKVGSSRQLTQTWVQELMTTRTNLAQTVSQWPLAKRGKFNLTVIPLALVTMTQMIK